MPVPFVGVGHGAQPAPHCAADSATQSPPHRENPVAQVDSQVSSTLHTTSAFGSAAQAGVHVIDPRSANRLFWHEGEASDWVDTRDYAAALDRALKDAEGAETVAAGVLRLPLRTPMIVAAPVSTV